MSVGVEVSKEQQNVRVSFREHSGGIILNLWQCISLEVSIIFCKIERNYAVPSCSDDGITNGNLTTVGRGNRAIMDTLPSIVVSVWLCRVGSSRKVAMESIAYNRVLRDSSWWEVLKISKPVLAHHMTPSPLSSIFLIS